MSDTKDHMIRLYGNKIASNLNIKKKTTVNKPIIKDKKKISSLMERFWQQN